MSLCEITPLLDFVILSLSLCAFPPIILALCLLILSSPSLAQYPPILCLAVILLASLYVSLFTLQTVSVFARASVQYFEADVTETRHHKN